MQDDDLMIINKSGVAIRMAVADLRVMGRATQGVRLIRVREDDAIAAVAKVMKEEEVEVELLEGEESSDHGDSDQGIDGTTLDNDETQTENNE